MLDVRIVLMCHRDVQSCAATRGTLGRGVGGGVAKLSQQARARGEKG